MEAGVHLDVRPGEVKAEFIANEGAGVLSLLFFFLLATTIRLLSPS